MIYNIEKDEFTIELEDGKDVGKLIRKWYFLPREFLKHKDTGDIENRHKSLLEKVKNTSEFYRVVLRRLVAMDKEKDKLEQIKDKELKKRFNEKYKAYEEQAKDLYKIFR